MTPPPHPPRRRRAILIAGFAIACAAAAGVHFDRTSSPVLISGPMVQVPQPGTVVILWEKRQPLVDRRGLVEWISPAGTTHHPARRTRQGRYEVRVTGLDPGTPYSYQVIGSSLFGRPTVLAGPFEVRTPPPPGTPFRFVALGDTGVGSLSQTGLAERIALARPDIVIHTGDVVYPAGHPSDYLHNFFGPNASFIPSVPFMPTLGNHDCATDHGRPLLDVFVLPENGPADIELERHYWFDYGDARFVALDSNKPGKKKYGVVTPEQMKTLVAPWLREVLTNCDARWKFVFFHHPFYTGSTHAADGAAYLKEAYVDVFEECGVDIVFAGHNHLYERTAAILDDRIVDDGAGVVYITTGAGGAARYPEELPPPDYIRAYDDKVLSFTQVDVSAERIELKQVNYEGQVIDEWTFAKPLP